MRNISIRKFDLHSSKKSNTNACLYIQINQLEISENDIDSELVYYLNKYDFFETIIFAGTEANLKFIQSNYFSSTSSLIKDRLNKKTADLSKNLKLLSYEQGAHKVYDINWITSTDITTEQIRQDCLTYLFKKSSAFKLAPEGLHYEAPSKHHNNVFLRTSSVLEYPGNLSILLFWMFPHIHNKQISHIYVDTSGILPLAIALAYEALKCNYVKQLPIVCSFNSYEGISKLKINFPETTLLLISASMSGGLGKEISRKISPVLLENTINLYLHNSQHDDIKSLCVINQHPQHEQVFGLVKIYTANECKLCKQGSIKTALHGDLFTIEPPKTHPIKITSSVLSTKNKKLLNQYSGIGFFKAYKHVSQGNRDIEIFLDVSKIFEYSGDDVIRSEAVDSFKKQWRKELLRSFTTNLKRIIYTHSPYSQDLAKEALIEYVKLNPSNTPVVVAHNNIDSSKCEDDASTLVISACLDNVRELAGINYDLRKPQPNGNVTYLSCVFRGASDTHRRQVKSSLTYNNDRPNDYDLYSVFSIDLPKCANKNSWQKELDCLILVEQWLNRQDDYLSLPKKISDRISFLKTAPSTGLSENLFWSSATDVNMKIQDGFVLIEKSASSNLSQSDIFVTVSMVLHALRNSDNVSDKLFSKPYHRAVIAPENFTKFNDGVLQSSLLRASRKDELNYMSDRKCSQEMTEIICEFIKIYKQPKAEALMEFFIALLTKSLVLCTDNLEEIFRTVKDSDIPEEYKVIIKYIEMNEGNR